MKPIAMKHIDRMHARELKKGSAERRRRFYRITAAGRKVLDEQRTWRTFAAAINRIAGVEPII